MSYVTSSKSACCSRINGNFKRFRAKENTSVVERADNSILWVNRYPADKMYSNPRAPFICWIASYPLDKVIRSLNNWALIYTHASAELSIANDKNPENIRLLTCWERRRHCATVDFSVSSVLLNNKWMHRFLPFKEFHNKLLSKFPFMTWNIFVWRKSKCHLESCARHKITSNHG